MVASTTKRMQTTTTLNKEMFKRSISILGLKAPKSGLKTLVTEFKGFLFCRQKFKHIVDADTDENKVVLLSETIKNETELPERLREYIDKNKLQVVNHGVQLNYENYSYEEVLKESLPENVPVPYAFERIGHIAHLNLRDEQLPFKNIIGQAIIDKKGPGVRTVLNKIGKIDTVFRTFNFELLAGDNDYIAEVKENECTFRFNFADVYWNSRLQYEHGQLVESFTKDDIVCDMFAGVGPFAVPAAKNKKVRVYANDLNPHSTKYMAENAARNKVSTSATTSKPLLSIFNMDARAFIRKLLLETSPPIPFTQVVMNLPSTSVEFLDVFKDIFLSHTIPPPIPPPTIHVYTFVSAGDDISERTRAEAEKILQHPLPNDYQCYEVRDVAPTTRMMHLSFKMPTILKYQETTEVSTSESLNNNNNNNNNLKRKDTEQDTTTTTTTTTTNVDEHTSSKPADINDTAVSVSGEGEDKVKKAKLTDDHSNQ
ncbi:tRNA (guanine-N1-)-methyltransferase [Cavenderia fasciculata]|uniref:tRNA (guanine(37)-N1)-methyltransferase n=1 Tax=Cavenderia fasciculata TaxID=261658 RepID=F4PUU9_CACFS|nr:tRNA (guanine-N1-)-methyltransferase [Cavenderia fasciculata]EGG21911.1 tRNA (guanine-N1-)-methyltransferase [Cavenderia fasciculata]|eukprot:XP_004359762.1 tRNA (guanine-N1-)-methyltransferase [Cavenderia fasciculata]